MTAKSGDKPNLGAISGPSTAPAKEPDDLTKGAIDKAKTDASKPTLSQRLDASVERHIASLCYQLDSTTLDNGRLRDDRDQLRRELDPLRLAHQKLKDTHRFSSIGNALSTILLTISSALISSAGLWPDYKSQIVVAGITMLACGLLVYGAITFFSLHKQ